MPSVNGVASGLDIDSLIKASLIFPKRQISLLEAKLAVKSAEKSIATKIGSNLATLESSADAVKKTDLDSKITQLQKDMSARKAS